MQINLGFTVNFRKQQDAANTLKSLLSSRRTSLKRLFDSSEFLPTAIFWLPSQCWEWLLLKNTLPCLLLILLIQGSHLAPLPKSKALWRYTIYSLEVILRCICYWWLCCVHFYGIDELSIGWFLRNFLLAQ